MSGSTVMAVEVEFEARVPTGISWRGSRWRVLDTPTRLCLSEAVLYSPWITHPSEPWTGWRFTAHSDVDGEVFVFDVKEISSGGFEVLRVFA